MSTAAEFRLAPSEEASPTWQRLKRYLEARLQRVREQNDSLLPADQTALLRGEIKALKGVLALGRELPPAEDPADVM